MREKDKNELAEQETISVFGLNNYTQIGRHSFIYESEYGYVEIAIIAKGVNFNLDNRIKEYEKIKQVDKDRKKARKEYLERKRKREK